MKYRTGIGAVILNQAGNGIWLFERVSGSRWQWPEGGVDDGEDLELALRREVYEEVGLRDFVIKAQTLDFIAYDFSLEHWPEDLKAQGIVGQRKKWFLLQCVTDDVVFNFNTHTTPEFTNYKLATAEECVLAAVEFKRAMYMQVLTEFGL